MYTIFFRTIILYLCIIVGIRLMGKRQVGELEPSELVLSFLIADLASVPMQDLGFPLHTGLIPIFTLIALSSILSVVAMKSLFLRNLLCGKPSIVIRNGTIDQKEMRRNRLTVDELLEELRTQGHTDLTTIHYAVLESNGMLSVLLESSHQPATIGEVEKLTGHQVSPSKIGLPRILVCDGVLLEQNLSDSGYNQEWLHQKLAEKHCHNLRSVFLFLVNEDGSYYFSKKSDPKGERK